MLDAAAEKIIPFVESVRELAIGNAEELPNTERLEKDSKALNLSAQTNLPFGVAVSSHNGDSGTGHTSAIREIDLKRPQKIKLDNLLKRGQHRLNQTCARDIDVALRVRTDIGP